MDAEIYQMVEALRARAEKIGLYMEQVAVASPSMSDPAVAAKVDADASLREMLDSGEVTLVMFAAFRPGEIAFSERVINEDAFKANQQFNTIVPTSKELKYDRIVERMSQASDDDDPLAFLDEEL